jgi:hypothetical protein
MGLSAAELEQEIRLVEEIQVMVNHQRDRNDFQSYRTRWPNPLADDRTMSALKRRVSMIIPGVSFTVIKPSGIKAVYPQVKLSVLRGKE